VEFGRASTSSVPRLVASHITDLIGMETWTTSENAAFIAAISGMK
jgi:hypothetical protein